MSVFADTSFLVSLYVPDVHSEEAARFMRHAELPIFLTPLGELELLNAIHLRLFRGELNSAEMKSALSSFRTDHDGNVFTLKSLSPSIFDRAKSIVRHRTPTLGTRTLDLLHVASALVLHAENFCTFDKNQRQLAKAEGLKLPL